MSSSDNISESITKFIDIKQKIAELEKKHDKYKSIIDTYMSEKKLSKLEQNLDGESYIIKKTASSRESISKKDLPEDIWVKYCSTSRFNVITVNKQKSKLK